MQISKKIHSKILDIIGVMATLPNEVHGIEYNGSQEGYQETS